MDSYILELLRWVQNVEMRLFKGQVLDEATALFRIEALNVLSKHNKIVLKVIEQNKIIVEHNLKKLKNAKKIDKETDSSSDE